MQKSTATKQGQLSWTCNLIGLHENKTTQNAQLSCHLRSSPSLEVVEQKGRD